MAAGTADLLDRTAPERRGSPSATGRPRGLSPSTFLALRPRLTTGVLVSSELVFQFDPVQSNAGAALESGAKLFPSSRLRMDVAFLDTVAFSQTACPVESSHGVLMLPWPTAATEDAHTTQKPLIFSSAVRTPST